MWSVRTLPILFLVHVRVIQLPSIYSSDGDAAAVSIKMRLNTTLVVWMLVLFPVTAITYNDHEQLPEILPSLFWPLKPSTVLHAIPIFSSDLLILFCFFLCDSFLLIVVGDEIFLEYFFSSTSLISSFHETSFPVINSPFQFHQKILKLVDGTGEFRTNIYILKGSRQ